MKIAARERRYFFVLWGNIFNESVGRELSRRCRCGILANGH